VGKQDKPARASVTGSEMSENEGVSPEVLEMVNCLLQKANEKVESTGRDLMKMEDRTSKESTELLAEYLIAHGYWLAANDAKVALIKIESDKSKINISIIGGQDAEG
jgi:hypothetical protein